MIVHDPGIEVLCGLNMLSPDLMTGLRAKHGGRKRADFDQRRIRCRPGDTVLCICDIEPSAYRQAVLARTRQLINFWTHYRKRNVNVNLTILNGKRKGELHAFFRLMLSKISARPALARVGIQGSTFLIYDIGYFDPICRGLQSHSANKVYAPWCGRLDANYSNEGAAVLDSDAYRSTRTRLRCVFAFKEQVLIYCLVPARVRQVARTLVGRQLDDVAAVAIDFRTYDAVIQDSVEHRHPLCRSMRRCCCKMKTRSSQRRNILCEKSQFSRRKTL